VAKAVIVAIGTHPVSRFGDGAPKLRMHRPLTQAIYPAPVQAARHFAEKGGPHA
jgi:hypothetical protein